MVTVAASFSFILNGASPPKWGVTAPSREFMPTYWWDFVFPGLFIVLTGRGVNSICDGLRDILDPRNRMGLVEKQYAAVVHT